MSTLGFFRVVGAAISNAADRAQLQLRGLGMDGDNAGSEPVDDAVHVQPLGLFARAVVAQSLRAIGWRDGDDVHVLALWNKQIAQSPAVDSGETRAYSVGAPKVCLRLGPVDVQIRVNVTGEVQLAPDAADYAGKSVARVGDAVACGRFVTVGADRDLYWLPPGAGFGGWVAIPNVGTAPTLAATGTAITAAISAGAAKVLA